MDPNPGRYQSGQPRRSPQKLAFVVGGMLILLSLSGASCTKAELPPEKIGHSDPSNLNSTQVPAPEALAQSGEAGPDTTRVVRIGSDGGTIELPAFAAVTFPPGALPWVQSVRVSATASPETEQDFEATAVLAFGAERLLRREIRINTGAVAPSKPVQVSVHVPGEGMRASPERRGLRVFAQYWQDGGQEILDQFEPIRSAYNRATGTLTIALDPAAFTDQRLANGTFEAVVIVGSLPQGAR